MLDIYSLKDKNGFVTGAAQGIGKACAKGFAMAGAQVAVVDINGEKAAQAAEEIARETGQKVIGIACDVTDAESVEQMMQVFLKEFGEIHFCHNNAGIVSRRPNVFYPAEDMPIEDWKAVIDVNLTGVFLTAQAAGKQMILQGKGGAILSTASMSASVANSPQLYCNYNASKGGVKMLSRVLAIEWAKYGIRVNTISPGNVMTPLAEFCSQEMIDSLNSRTPLQRFSMPDEMIGAAVYLVSDAASYQTGSDVLVDGGYTAW